MYFNDLVEAVNEKMENSSPKYTANILNTAFEIIKKEIATGNEVRIHNFGTFKISERAEREGRNHRPAVGDIYRRAIQIDDNGNEYITSFETGLTKAIDEIICGEIGEKAEVKKLKGYDGLIHIINSKKFFLVVENDEGDKILATREFETIEDALKSLVDNGEEFGNVYDEKEVQICHIEYGRIYTDYKDLNDYYYELKATAETTKEVAEVETDSDSVVDAEIENAQAEIEEEMTAEEIAGEIKAIDAAIKSENYFVENTKCEIERVKNHIKECEERFNEYLTLDNCKLGSLIGEAKSIKAGLERIEEEENRLAVFEKRIASLENERSQYTGEVEEIDPAEYAVSVEAQDVAIDSEIENAMDDEIKEIASEIVAEIKANETVNNAEPTKFEVGKVYFTKNYADCYGTTMLFKVIKRDDKKVAVQYFQTPPRHCVGGIEPKNYTICTTKENIECVYIDEGYTLYAKDLENGEYAGVNATDDKYEEMTIIDGVIQKVAVDAEIEQDNKPKYRIEYIMYNSNDNKHFTGVEYTDKRNVAMERSADYFFMAHYGVVINQETGEIEYDFGNRHLLKFYFDNLPNETETDCVDDYIVNVDAAAEIEITFAQVEKLIAEVDETNAQWIEKNLDEIRGGEIAIDSITSRIEKITAEFNEVKDTAEQAKAKEFNFLLYCTNEEIDFSRQRINDALKALDGGKIKLAREEIDGMIERIDYAEETFDRAHSILADIEEINAEEKLPSVEEIFIKVIASSGINPADNGKYYLHINDNNRLQKASRKFKTLTDAIKIARIMHAEVRKVSSHIFANIEREDKSDIWDGGYITLYRIDNCGNERIRHRDTVAAIAEIENRTIEEVGKDIGTYGDNYGIYKSSAVKVEKVNIPTEIKKLPFKMFMSAARVIKKFLKVGDVRRASIVFETQKNYFKVA